VEGDDQFFVPPGSARLRPHRAAASRNNSPVPLPPGFGVASAPSSTSPPLPAAPRQLQPVDPARASAASIRSPGVGPLQEFTRRATPSPGASVPSAVRTHRPPEKPPLRHLDSTVRSPLRTSSERHRHFVIHRPCARDDRNRHFSLFRCRRTPAPPESSLMYTPIHCPASLPNWNHHAIGDCCRAADTALVAASSRRAVPRIRRHRPLPARSLRQFDPNSFVRVSRLFFTVTLRARDVKNAMPRSPATPGPRFPGTIE